MNNVARFIHQYQQQQVQLNHRGLVCLVGEQAWFLEQVNAFMAMHELLVSPIVTLTYSTATATSEVLQSNFHTNTYANIQVKQVDKKNYRYLLGTETDYFIYLNDDIEPDMFAALCGTIKAGGLVFIGWRTIPTNKSSIYHQRFYRELCYSQSTLIFLQKSSDLENEKYLLAVLAATKLKRTEDASQLESCQIELCESPEKLNFHCVTEDQLFAVEAIKKVMLGHRNRPLTLTADRGRGKTTALALACIELIKSSDTSLNIVITAPNIAALSSFFRTIELFLPSALVDKSQVHFNHSTIKFLPLDCLLTEKPAAHLLLVDEAAALPLYLLNDLFVHYHRLVFSTTLHGYEGAGRGFALKIAQLHQQHQLKFKTVQLRQPIRWNSGDPLEQFVFNSCLLNAELTNFELFDHLLDGFNKQFIQPSYLKFVTYVAEDLLKDEALLKQVFSVLVTAHYQTTPSDLLLILDNPNVLLKAMVANNMVVAVTLIMKEGDLDASNEVSIEERLSPQLVEQIKQGKRRIKNHFLPQSLLSHCGAAAAFNYSYWRIIRIAVHPLLQNKGIGQAFLRAIENNAITEKIDLLGTSFGCNSLLYNFWHQANWQIARLGFTKDQASGEYSALLLKPLSASAAGFTDDIVTEFYRSFVFLLTEQFSQLATPLATDILANYPPALLPQLTASDLKNIDDFASGYRQFDHCAFSLHLWLIHQCYALPVSAREQLLPLVARLLQKQSVAEVSSKFSLTGKKQLNQLLVERVKLMLL